MVKKEFNVGRIQLGIGVLLLVGSAISMIYVGNAHENEINMNAASFIDQVKYFQTQNFTNDESRVMTAVGISQNHYSKNSYLKLRFLIWEMALLVVFIMSILFITQGAINSKK